MGDAAYLDTLNAEQRQAVSYGIEPGASPGPPLLVIAGAGSGKTHTLAHRVAHLIVNGADPARILLLTFTRRACEEMTGRVRSIVAKALGVQKASGKSLLPWAGTFHGVSAQLVREHAEQIGFSPQFTILDRQDAADLMNLVRHELGMSLEDRRFPNKNTCLAIYSRTMNADAELAATLRDAFRWCSCWETELRRLFGAYVDAKQRQDVLDFDDLLLVLRQMLADRSIAANLSNRFDHILVDEYQDTNRVQSAILRAIKPDGRGLTVIGDDAQAIYSFRAATIQNILEFPGSFAPTPKIIKLERNYRSFGAILDAANAVIALAPDRFTKNLRPTRARGAAPQLVSVRDERQQAVSVTDLVLENREGGQALSAQAVLFRASHHSAELELELARRGVPFKKYGGLRFFDMAHVKDVMAVLRFAENPRDRVAGFRSLQLVPGVGPVLAGRALESFAAASYDVASLATGPAHSRCGPDWRKFIKLLLALRTNAAGWPAEFDCVRSWYAPHLARMYDDSAERSADLTQLEHMATAAFSRREFLTDLTLDPPSAGRGEASNPPSDTDHLTLSTIHSAKGMEWRSVFLLNAVEGCIPSELATGTHDEIEEERRLLYVAMTRARDDLVIMIPQRAYAYRRPVGDRYVTIPRSRFITSEMDPLFAQTSWRPRSSVVAVEPKRRFSDVDVRSRMRERWTGTLAPN